MATYDDANTVDLISENIKIVNNMSLIVVFPPSREDIFEMSFDWAS